MRSWAEAFRLEAMAQWSLADYESVSIEDWVERFRMALGGPPIRTVPRKLAIGFARIGDLLNKLGWPRFPFNSFRLRNALTPYVLDLASTRSVCGELPFSMEQGVMATAEWILSALD
jgi:hypothetical protein